MSKTIAAAFAGVLLAVALRAQNAEAYPQWQFSSGTSRCSQCHYSPAGGGLINGYGRDAAADDLSTWDGDGSFLHGAMELPGALALGFDGRFAALANNLGEARGATLAYFPMQADGYIRLQLGEAFSVYGSVGYRGQARSLAEPTGQGAAVPASGSRFISREHYLMWQPAAMGPYARIGRFFAPFGLRLAEHYAYVRRDLGFNLLEEPYSFSLGLLRSAFDLHFTAFLPDVVRDLGSQESGAAGMVERRVGDAGAIGLQAKYGQTEDLTRLIGGVFVKSYIEATRALIQSELNVVHSIVDDTDTDGFVGYVGLTFFPTTGLWVTPFGERKQTSIAVRNTAYNAGGIQINWFPLPHWELTWMGRFQIPTGDATSVSSLLFLHYYM
jgi:hypothetical protein